MANPVDTDIVNGALLVAINNPPVNAASQAVRAGLHDAIVQGNAEAGVDLIVLYAEGRTFIAGADIKEFGKPPADPWLPEVCNTIENSGKPVIAVLHGTTLGGGLEVSLSAHARVALPGTKVGLPEVNLGILPGAGGTQRAPRLVGIPAALDMILSGRHVPVDEALALGLVDQLEDGAPREVAVRAITLWREGAIPTRKTSELDVSPDNAALDIARAETCKKHPHLFSPHKCIDSVAASVLPINDGLRVERALFNECLDSPQRAGLIHAFFAERAVAKIPEAQTKPRTIESVGIVGGGLMGTGIATACLFAGLPVTLIEQSAQACEKAQMTVIRNLDAAVSRGKLSDNQRRTILHSMFSVANDVEALGQADVVIEAVYENLAAKTSIFQALDKVCKPGAILATNTSYLNVNEIADVTARPQDVMGLHFFSPAHIMRLLEVVVADSTAPETVATGFALSKKLRKIGVRAGVCDGFIGNRILATTRKVADHMLIDGATPQQIDEALEAFGFAMGPYRVLDMAGLDISWANRKRQAEARPKEERYVSVGDRMCENGWFGRKSGRGYYLYDGETVPNRAVLTLIEDERKTAGIAARAFDADEITARYMAAMALEGARIVEEGIALRPIDVDAVLLFGYGFPRFRGGPMHWADCVGATELVARIDHYAKKDAHFWKIPTSLRNMARDGATFAERN